MTKLVNDSMRYFDYLEKWLESLAVLEIDLSKPEETAVMVVDMTDGFCTQGALASPRMKHIEQPIADLLRSAWEKRVRNIYLVNDNHEPDAIEFGSYPPHCVVGSPEAMPIQQIRELPFYNQISVVPKNSLSPQLNTRLPDILASRRIVKNFIVVGNCTDLCVYQMAMYLRMDANSQQIADRQVIVPVDCIDTYDMPLETAKEVGAVPHPAELMHAIFLQHMYLNGVEIAASLKIK